MENRKLVLSEILFVVQNKFGTTPSNNLQNIIASFYSDEEVWKGKKILHEIAVDLFGEREIGRCVSRTTDNKRRMNTADLIDLYGVLDRKKASLPCFVAANMSRIPGIRSLESDVMALSASLGDLKHQVLFMQSTVGKFQHTPVSQTVHAVELARADAYSELAGNRLVVNLETSNDANIKASPSASASSVQLSSSDSTIDSKLVVDDELVPGSDEWTVVNRRGKDLKAAVSSDTKRNDISGKRELCDSKIKAVTVSRAWHCKIGRLDKNVTVAAVKEHLHDMGIEAISVEKLNSKSGASLSMHVVVPYDAKDEIMCSDFWPRGIRVSG
jgi:hypothetical protein